MGASTPLHSDSPKSSAFRGPFLAEFERRRTPDPLAAPRPRAAALGGGSPTEQARLRQTFLSPAARIPVTRQPRPLPYRGKPHSPRLFPAGFHLSGCQHTPCLSRENAPQSDCIELLKISYITSKRSVWRHSISAENTLQLAVFRTINESRGSWAVSGHRADAGRREVAAEPDVLPVLMSGRQNPPRHSTAVQDRQSGR